MTVCDVFFHAKTSLLIFEVQLLHWSIMHHALVLGCHRGDPVNKNDMFGLKYPIRVEETLQSVSANLNKQDGSVDKRNGSLKRKTNFILVN